MTNVKTYRKKPTEIQAIQFTGDNLEECKAFISDSFDRTFEVADRLDHINIITLEGIMRCDKNDYIIKGIKGEFYPCKPDIFELTYEEVK